MQREGLALGISRDLQYFLVRRLDLDSLDGIWIYYGNKVLPGLGVVPITVDGRKRNVIGTRIQVLNKRLHLGTAIRSASREGPQVGSGIYGSVYELHPCTGTYRGGKGIELRCGRTAGFRRIGILVFGTLQMKEKEDDEAEKDPGSFHTIRLGAKNTNFQY